MIRLFVTDRGGTEHAIDRRTALSRLSCQVKLRTVIGLRATIAPDN
ncbi:hypothetical protein V475_15955 [Sphingobium baderi LL03]|uniref:Uncharacterized protein n=1 Tax=Sphingobium baderi LL03 TaxID=1114964 RepID=T0HU56_9SPHN|nr:hypothetical protein [Sphingobium baderi]EQB01064.1 hypothetical protein L485_11410 [Sphingobium baderi LL03]KMS61042.1 hypothetical protein V475_15955 [Sphingobium baderi LL03]